jgi:cytochrome c553
MLRLLVKLAAVGAVLAVGGFLVAASGVMPIKASSGHWPITEWFLHFSMQRSVSTHSLAIQVPPLDDQRLVLIGAGHFETGCRPCHGSPDMPQPRIPAAMTPHPPDLSVSVPKWDPEELFYLVKHGVKFTGMPAWPTQQRDDEVWAVTAFLLKLPDMDAQQYRRLVHGEADETGDAAPIQDLLEPDAARPAVIESCARCHGLKGQGRGGAFPALAGQSSVYLEAALEAYALGKRHSGIMSPIAAALTHSDMQQLARYYSTSIAPQPKQPPETSEATDRSESTERREAIDRGEAISSHGIPANRVPACVGCHGLSDSQKNPHYPALAGQHADYLVQQLDLFRTNSRGGSPYAHLMRPIASQLSQDQIRDVALHYASLDGASASD